MDALGKIDKGFLSTVKSYLNNPLYSFLLPVLGINKQVALQKINELEKMMNGESISQVPSNTTQMSNTQSSFPTNPKDDLSKFRRGLNSF